MIFVHSFWSNLQFVLSTEHISSLSLWMRSSLAKERRELSGRDDLPQSSGRPLEIVPVEGTIRTFGVESRTEHPYLIVCSSFLPGHQLPAAMILPLPGLTK